MEADFRSFDWALFDRTGKAMGTADEAVKRFDEAAAKAEYDRKAAEMLARLKPGVKVNFGKPHAWSAEEMVKTIEKVTAKRVMFKEDFGKQQKLGEMPTIPPCRSLQSLPCSPFFKFVFVSEVLV